MEMRVVVNCCLYWCCKSISQDFLLFLGNVLGNAGLSFHVYWKLTEDTQ